RRAGAGADDPARHHVSGGVRAGGAAGAREAADAAAGPHARPRRAALRRRASGGAGPSPRSVVLSGRSDRPEEAVALAGGAGGEEERVGGAVVGEGSLAELERPQTVDRQHAPSLRAQLPTRLELPGRLPLEGRDLAVAEVADEEIAAEAAEARRSEREAPRRVQLPVGRHPAEQRAARVELVDEAETLAGDVVVAVGVLLRIGHEDVAADVLDPERRVAGRNRRVDEGTRRVHVAEAPVEDVDLPVVEVGRVQPV